MHMLPDLGENTTWEERLTEILVKLLLPLGILVLYAIAAFDRVAGSSGK